MSKGKKKKSYQRSTFVDKENSYEFTPAYHTKGYYNPNKSSWKINDADVHTLFKKAYDHDICHCRDGKIGEFDLDYVWLNDKVKGLASVSTFTDPKSGLLKLRELGDDEKYFAYFPLIHNQTESWHGYPERGGKIGMVLAKYWKDKGIISPRDYIRIRRNEI